MLNQLSRMAKYSVALETDTLILIIDDNELESPSVTNSADQVIADLSSKHDLQSRKVYYRDSAGTFDELIHLDGKFLGFAPCTKNQRVVFRGYL